MATSKPDTPDTRRVIRYYPRARVQHIAILAVICGFALGVQAGAALILLTFH